MRYDPEGNQNKMFLQFSIRLGIFLRRYPMARVFVIVYMVSVKKNKSNWSCYTA